jgi:hypothetical protein
MCGKIMAWGMSCNLFVDLSLAGSLFERSPQGYIIQMVPSGDATSGINGALFGREDILPNPLAIGLGRFAGKGVGEIDRAVS